MMADSDDLAGAIEVLSDALTLTPDWAAGWFQLGEYLERADQPTKAAEAWHRVVTLDPSDPFGAGLKLDLLRTVPVAETMPSAFVELLFDQYASRFEASLLDHLEYRGPNLLMGLLRRAGFSHARQALDLGCGTGLMGMELRSVCDWLGGFDISQGMLDEAAAKGLYDRLEKHDLNTLIPCRETYDLIVAADVFIYLGALEQIVAWSARALSAQGWFAFTLERGEDDTPIALQESRRFAHSPAYVTEVLQHAGFRDILLQECVLRQDRGQDIRALCVAASRQKTVSARDQDGERLIPA